MNALDRVLLRAREALGPWPGTAIECTGRARHFGTDAPLRLVVARDGRMRREIGGPLAETLVSDGRRVWQLERSDSVRELELAEREQALAECWAWSGLWAEAGAGLALRVGDDGALTMRIAAGRHEFRLQLDERTGLARSLETRDWFGARSLELSDPRTVHGRRWLHAARGPSLSDAEHELALERCTLLADVDPALFSAPSPATSSTRFDAHATAEVELRRAPTGHLFVRPRIDGRELGWFAFDTGAAVAVIDPRAAAAAGMQPVGTTALIGAGASRHRARLVRGGALALGPLTIRELVWTESDALRPLVAVLGEPVAGVLGWDVLARTVAELETARPRLALFDPRHYALARGAWQPLVLYRRHPFVRARFEGDREGLFCIDTGAGDVTVFFHSPAVRELGLEAGRELQDARAFGAGGELALRVGPLAWFELGGRRTAELQAIFCLDESGAMADADSTGTLGQALLEPFRLVLDYSGRRAAFAPSEP